MPYSRTTIWEITEGLCLCSIYGLPHLQYMEALPASPQAEDPDKEGAAGVDGTTRRAAQIFGHADAEEVEEGNGHHASHRCDLQVR